ncbi:MAG: DUF3488 and transglutaminase-like domain-containing protein [Planctomycetota bacterium]|nr:DUF3488 and transglutaminase-like domain-containing protein [Planctomycetota bacterium]
MNRALRLCMVGLVLVNLAFVQITESASWTWLAPLFALTVAAPFLLPLTRFLLYRLAWNSAVLGAFAMLVHNTTTSGAAHLLEDGLLLAALCQVHLLNNITSAQKPDLLFFNSFLIAVVTSFLSLDVAYSALFLLYAPILVVAMQVLALERAGVRSVSRRVVTGGLFRAGTVLACTLLVFFFLPRDFTRRGLLGDKLNFRPPGGLMQVDFSEQIELDRSGSVGVSDKVIMRVRLKRGTPSQVPTHWRGATLDTFDGKEWKPVPEGHVEEPLPWMAIRRGDWMRVGRGAGARVEVELESRSARRLFAPLSSTRLLLQPPADRLAVRSMRDRSFVVHGAGGWQRTLRYNVDMEPPGARNASPMRWSRNQRTHLRLLRGSVPAKARELAAQIGRDLPSDAPREELVEEIRRFVSDYNRYLPPGAPGGARNLEDFFDGRASAHCEVFATALAVMLRSRIVPCRVVTGYRSDEWDAEGTVLTIRAYHAHAWVEVLDPYRGWYTVDSTPMLDADAAAAAMGWFARIRSYAASLWASVTSFNAEAREQVVAWWSRAVRWWHALVAVGAAVGLWFLRRRLRHRRRPRAVREYLRCLERLGLECGAGETPRELLARVASPPELAEATAQHERARYGCA